MLSRAAVLGPPPEGHVPRALIPAALGVGGFPVCAFWPPMRTPSALQPKRSAKACIRRSAELQGHTENSLESSDSDLPEKPNWCPRQFFLVTPLRQGVGRYDACKSCLYSVLQKPTSSTENQVPISYTCVVCAQCEPIRCLRGPAA